MPPAPARAQGRTAPVAETRASLVLFCGHVEETGTALFDLACQHDLEGVVAKHKFSPYLSGRNETTWFKIRNRSYSQWAGREELFEREREQVPANAA